MDLHQIATTVIRVELDLIYMRAQAMLEELLQVSRLEVGGSDRTHQPRIEETNQAVECIDVTILVRVGPMNQQQVYVVQPQPLEAGFAGCASPSILCHWRLNLLVTKTSGRLIPDRRIPSPTPLSFP